MNEHRYYRRIDFRTEADIYIHDHIYRCDLVDLALKGALFRTEQPLPLVLGQQARLSIYLPDTAIRMEFESISISFGCFTVIEVRLIILPHLFPCIWGTTCLMNLTTCMNVRLKVLIHCLSVTSKKLPAGGPPVFVTRISTSPNFSEVKSTTFLISPGMEKSAGTTSASPPKDLIS